MEIIAKLIITFTLGYMIAYSLKRWMKVTISIFGILAIPLILLIFFAGDNHTAWSAIGAGLGILLTGTINMIKAAYASLPIITIGTSLGLIAGSGLFAKQ